MSESAAGASLDALLARLAAEHPGAADAASTPPPPPGFAEPVLHEFIFSMLLWESSFAKACDALNRLAGHFADANDLRVAFPAETARLLPPGTPRRGECAERLHAALHDIFRRENDMSLARLADSGKREARSYLTALEGVPPFVAARVCLFALGGHAVPVDGRVAQVLAGAGVIEPDAAPGEAIARLERLVKAADARRVALLLEAAGSALDPEPLDESARAPAPRRPARSGAAPARTRASKPASKKTTKKAGRPRGGQG